MGLPVISVEQMRNWENDSWAAGISQAEVIAEVGLAVARVALRLTRPGDRILILAGKGHNGDDARAAAPHLPGRQVTLLNVSSPTLVRPQVAALLAEEFPLAIDGLFGIGLNRPLDTGWAELIEEINGSGVPILSIDVPSGLNADTGEPQNTALCAQLTLTLGVPKSGLLRSAAQPFVGRLEVAPDIGLLQCPYQSELTWNDALDFLKFPPNRTVSGHKGTFGHVAVLAGSEGYHGAAVLAARAALRAAPGLVSVYCDGTVYQPVASQLQAAMVHPVRLGTGLPATCTAIVAGPGLASRDLPPVWRKMVDEHWNSSPHAIVVDASALEWLTPGPTPLNSRRFITPHPGEAARLLGTSSAAIQENRPAAVREISARYGNCWVILKGQHTLIGRASGDLFVNSSGNSWLAQGGSGDVLAGYLGGLLAQPKLQAHPLKTARYAVWEHGATADRLCARFPVWTIENLVSTIGAARANPD